MWPQFIIPLHLFLGHVVADHGFTNNAKIREYRGLKLVGHMVWSILAILAFTFDTLLKTLEGRMVLLASFLVHVAGDYLRTEFHRLGKKRWIDFLELFELIFFFVVNWYFKDLLNASYLSTVFVFYLIGMNLVSVAATYFFRNFKPGNPNISDIEGISERLAFFVFYLAGKPLFAFLSLLIGFLYRLWKFRKPREDWWVSPAWGILVSVLWKFLMYRGLA